MSHTEENKTVNESKSSLVNESITSNIVLKPQQKTTEPIWWLIFGFGGTFTALLVPIIIIIVASGLVSQDAAIWLFQSGFGRFLMIVTAILILWGAIHRIRHMLHDFKIHLPHDKCIFYGIALVLSILIIIA